METMDEDTKAERIASLVEKRDRLRQQLVSLDEEYALVEKEVAFLQGSPGIEPTGWSRVAMEEQITCKHSCTHHIALMDPAVWRNLPGEVLQMVFARLPLHQIISIQCLSREWNVTVKESGFWRLCASAASRTSKMFAFVDEAIHGKGIVSIRLFDANSQRWHAFEMTLRPEFYCDTMSACDGGLVCFVSRMSDKVANPLVIVVLNPLTKEYKVLPALSSLNKVQPTMVQLLMDHETKCYKVVVVGKKQRRTGTVLMKVYDSATSKWSSPNAMSDLVFGYHFQWTPDGDEEFAGERVGPCVYDCREGQLLKFGEHVNPFLECCKGYALVKDHLFVLHYEVRNQRCRPDVGGYTQSSRFILSEYQGHKSSPHWVRLRVHECTPLERPYGRSPLSENWHMVLHACRGFLMVTASNDELGPFKLIRTWLYDLSTCEWQELPALPTGQDPDHDHEPCIQEAMCELHWDAVP